MIKSTFRTLFFSASTLAFLLFAPPDIYSEDTGLGVRDLDDQLVDSGDIYHDIVETYGKDSPEAQLAWEAYVQAFKELQRLEDDVSL